MLSFLVEDTFAATKTTYGNAQPPGKRFPPGNWSSQNLSFSILSMVAFGCHDQVLLSSTAQLYTKFAEAAHALLVADTYFLLGITPCKLHLPRSSQKLSCLLNTVHAGCIWLSSGTSDQHKSSDFATFSMLQNLTRDPVSHVPMHWQYCLLALKSWPPSNTQSVMPIFTRSNTFWPPDSTVGSIIPMLSLLLQFLNFQTISHHQGLLMAIGEQSQIGWHYAILGYLGKLWQEVASLDMYAPDSCNSSRGNSVILRVMMALNTTPQALWLSRKKSSHYCSNAIKGNQIMRTRGNLTLQLSTVPTTYWQ